MWTSLNKETGKVGFYAVDDVDGRAIPVSICAGSRDQTAVPLFASLTLPEVSVDGAAMRSQEARKSMARNCARNRSNAITPTRSTVECAQRRPREMDRSESQCARLAERDVELARSTGRISDLKKKSPFCRAA